MTIIYTIGHGRLSLVDFAELLTGNQITTLMDIRSAPYSRFNPQFNKESLESEMACYHIDYVYGGKVLGGRPNDPRCYKSGRLPQAETDYLHEVDYLHMMEMDWFKRGIQWLLRLAEEQVIAILCSEEDPAHCHRHHLIARYLLDEYGDEVDMLHIRADGSVYRAATLLFSVNEPQAEQLALL